MDFKEKILAKRKELQEKQQKELERKQLMTTIAAGNKKVSDTINKNKPSDEVNVKNMPRMARPEDIDVVAKNIDDLIISHTVTSDDLAREFNDIASGMLVLSDEISKLPKEYDTSNVVTGLDILASSINRLPSQMPRPEKLAPLLEAVKDLSRVVKNKDYKPTIEVSSPEVEVPPIDTKSIEKAIDKISKAVKDIKQPELDISPLMTAVNAVESSISNLKFPVPNYILPYAKNTDGSAHQATIVESSDTPGVWGVVVLNADGSAVTTGGSSSSDGAFDGMDGNDLEFMDGNSMEFMSG